MSRDYYQGPFNKRPRLSRGNQGWPDSSRDQRIWLNAPPGLSRQESGHKEEQQLFYRRDQIDSVNREVHSRHQRSEHRFESRYDSMRRSEPNPFNFQVQDQNLRPDDLRCRLWDQGEAAGQWSSEIKVAYESRVIVSRTETFSSGSSFRDHSQGQTLEVSSKRSRQEQELGPEETPMQRKLYNSGTRLDQLAIAENKKKEDRCAFEKAIATLLYTERYRKEDFPLELLKSELLEMKQMLATEKSQSEKLKKDLDEAKKKIQELDLENHELKKSTTDLQTRFESQKKELTLLASELSDAKASEEKQKKETKLMLKAERRQNEKLKQGLDEAKKKIQDLDLDYHKMKKSKTDLETRFESQEKELTVLESELSDAKALKEKQKEELSKLASELSDLKALKEKQKEELSQLVSKLSDVKTSEERQKEELSQLASELSDVKALKEKQIEELSSLASELSDVKASKEKFKSDLTASHKKVAYLEVSQQAMSQELEDTKADIAVLVDQCTTHKKELAKLKTGHSQAKSSIKRLELELKQEQKRSSDLESYHQELIFELNKSRTNYALVEEERAAREKLQQALSDVTKKFEDQERRRLNLNSDFEKSKTRANELGTQCKTINAKLSSALEDARQLQQMKERLENDLSQEKKKFNDLYVHLGKRNTELQKQIATVAQLINERKSFQALLNKSEHDAKCLLEEKDKLVAALTEEKKRNSNLESQYKLLLLEFDRNGTIADRQTIELESIKTQFSKAQEDARRALDEKEKLKLESSDAKGKLEALTVENEQLASNLSKFESIVPVLKEKYARHKTERAKALQDIKEANDAIEKLQLDLSTAKKKLEDMSVQNQKLNSELENCVKSDSEKTAVIKKYKAEFCKIQEDVKRADDAKEKLVLDLYDANKKLEDMSVQNQRLNSELENQVKRDSERFESCKAELCKAQEDFKRADDAKEKLELALSEARRTYSDLYKQHQDLVSQIEHYQAKVAKQAIHNDMQKKELTEQLRANFVFNNLNKMMQTKLSDLESITERQNETIRNNTAESVTKDRLNQSLKDKNLELQKMIGVKDKELSAERSQTTSLKKVLEALKPELEELKQQRGKLMLRLDQVSADHRKALDGLIDANDKEFQRLNQKITELTESRKLLKGELIKLESSNKDLQKRTVELLNKYITNENEKAKLSLTIAQQNLDIKNLSSKEVDLNKDWSSKLNRKTEKFEEQLCALQRSLDLEKSKNKVSDFVAMVDVKKKENDVQSHGFVTRLKRNSKDHDDDIVILDQKDDVKLLQQRILSQDDRISLLQRRLDLAQNTLAIKKNEVLNLKRLLHAK